MAAGKLGGAVGGNIRRFVQEQGAKSVAMTDRITGCRHEEGVDYPEGQVCPTIPVLGAPRPLDRRHRAVTLVAGTMHPEDTWPRFLWARALEGEAG
jgi:hypothetical protein